MENSGARKISKFEHKKEVSLIILKHAAEEHRHAYYLKKQISKLVPSGFETYDDSFLINPRSSRFYLDVLDLRVSQYAKKKLGLTGYDVKWAAYLLVTYAIELRADELYPIYQQILTETKSKVQVKSIIVEEEGHLEEMIAQLKSTWPDWEQHAAVAVQIETELYQDWVSSLVAEVA
jgi:rubrerythrin